MLGLSPTLPSPRGHGHGPRVTLVLCFSTCNVTNKPELYTDQYKIINSSVVRHVQRENNLRGEKTCPLNKSYLTCMYVHNVLNKLCQSRRSLFRFPAGVRQTTTFCHLILNYKVWFRFHFHSQKYWRPWLRHSRYCMCSQNCKRRLTYISVKQWW